VLVLVLMEGRKTEVDTSNSSLSTSFTTQKLKSCLAPFIDVSNQ
jgi:hypothetical protein